MSKFRVPQYPSVYIDKAKITKGKRGGSILYIINLEEALNNYTYEINENALVPESSIVGAHRHLLFRYQIIYSNWWWDSELTLKEQERYYGHILDI